MDIERKEKFVKANSLMLALLYDYQERIASTGAVLFPDIKEICGDAIAIIATSLDKLIQDDPTLESRIDHYLNWFTGEKKDEKASEK